MTTSLIAARLVELYRRGEYTAAQAELYADDAVSVEPQGTPQPFAQGKPALAAKTRMFAEMFETRSGFISHPIIADPFFACTMSLDVTDRKTGAQFTVAEVAVFETRGDKIVREQFFYSPPAIK
jgi:ketosteroid isomerase-like protein